MSPTGIRTRARQGFPRLTGRVFRARMLKVQSAFREHGIEALLVTRPSSLRYLSGFTGSNGLLVLRSRSVVLVTDGRYQVQAREESMRAVRVVIVRGSLIEGAVRTGFLRKLSTIGFDDGSVTLRMYRDMKRVLSSASLKPVAGFIEDFAEVKEALELAALKMAARISDSVIAQLLPLVRPGVQECDLASEITYRQRRLGAERDSFEPIVASGPRTAMPHARAGSRTLREGDAVLFDLGCVVSGYGSDITRTVFLGKPDPRLRKVYGIVRSAQDAALQAVHAGVSARAVDAAAREVIARAGYARNFPHSLGHGIGLEVHERPRLAPSSKDTLRAGHAITIEPGIYLPGAGGVRIEDDVYVHDRGCDLLTHSPRELIQL